RGLARFPHCNDRSYYLHTLAPAAAGLVSRRLERYAIRHVVALRIARKRLRLYRRPKRLQPLPHQVSGIAELAHKLRRLSKAQPKHIVEDPHLPIAIRP